MAQALVLRRSIDYVNCVAILPKKLQKHGSYKRLIAVAMAQARVSHWSTIEIVLGYYPKKKLKMEVRKDGKPHNNLCICTKMWVQVNWIPQLQQHQFVKFFNNHSLETILVTNRTRNSRQTKQRLILAIQYWRSLSSLSETNRTMGHG